MSQNPNNPQPGNSGQNPGMPPYPYGAPPPNYGQPPGMPPYPYGAPPPNYGQPQGPAPSPYRGIPPYGPPPLPLIPPQRRRGLTSRGIIAILAMIVVVGLLALCGIINSRNATTSSPAQDLYNNAIQGTPILNNPLNDGNLGQWDNQPIENGSCSFSAGQYHVKEVWKGYDTLCVAHAAVYANFVYQVQMNITQGDGGGIFFRADAVNGKFYRFLILQDGNYSLTVYTDLTGKNARILQNGTLPTAFNSGLNQNNTVAVAAKGSDIYLYVNGQYVTSATDSSYSSGMVGVFAGGPEAPPTEVVFSNAKVWNL